MKKRRATTTSGKSSAKRAARKSGKRATSTKPPRHEFTEGLYGWITHTDLASADPAATKAWCAKVLGWTFTMDLPMGNGQVVHLFAYSEKGGGAVRPVSPPEIPGSIPYVHVADADAAFRKAIAAGAEEMLAPTRVMEGVKVAIVRAPGGVPIGLSGP
jgi:predicted enzyme related to lactoylglutathione lyase